MKYEFDSLQELIIDKLIKHYGHTVQAEDVEYAVNRELNIIATKLAEWGRSSTQNGYELRDN